MSQVVHKYLLQIGTKVSIDFPVYSQVVKAGMSQGQPAIWVRKNPHIVGPGVKHFYVAATGEAMPDNAGYIDTVFQGPYVWHVFQVPDDF